MKKKKATYLPLGINNFHNSPAIELFITGEKTSGLQGVEVYRISKGQEKRLEKHFCGITDCRCHHGAIEQLDEAGTELGIKVDWCAL